MNVEDYQRHRRCDACHWAVLLGQVQSISNSACQSDYLSYFHASFRDRGLEGRERPSNRRKCPALAHVAGYPRGGDSLGDHGQRRHSALLFGFGHYGVEVVQDFGDGHGINLAAGVVSLFDQLLEVAAGDLRG
jgi:hypothetical protein